LGWRQFAGRRDGLEHTVKRKAPQLLDARLRPAEQVEAALEHLSLRQMRRRGIAVGLRFTRQKQCLEFAVEPLAARQTRLREGHCKCRPELQGSRYHGVCIS